MPRVTRRSVAAKEDSTPEETSRSTSRGRRGAKKDEPAAEEPQEATPKRGGRQAAKAEPAKRGRGAARGRSTSRGGRGKKEEEPEENEEEEAVENEEEAEEEEKTPRGGARSRGRGKGGRGGKAAARGGRGTSRGRRGKAAEEDEEEEEEENEEEKTEEPPAEEAEQPARGRGGRSKAAAAATPPARGGRRGRGKAEENESQEAEEESKEVENETEAAPKGRQRRTPNKAAETKVTTPPSGGRRGRGQKAEPASATSPAPEKAADSAEPSAEESAAAVPEKKEETAEAMETESEKPAAPAKMETEEAASTKATDESKKEPESPSKKRKLEEDESEHVAKKARTSESEPAKEEKSDIEDFVVVNKDDVPAPDSKEVAASLPPTPQAKLSQPTTPEDSRPEGPRIQPLMSAPGVPVVVPLTEAELAKQYTSLQRQDRDETSSTLVEVGSECASDITGLSARGLDVSDAVSIDSTSQDQPQDESEWSSFAAKGSGAVAAANIPLPESNVPAPPRASPAPAAAPPLPPQQNVSTFNAAPAFSSPSMAAPPLSTPPNFGVNTNANEPTQRPPAPMEVHAASLPVVNATSVLPTQPPLPPSQNGTSQGLVNSGPLLTSTPAKPPVTEPYVPSSPAIDSRRFHLNPAFPVEMMDPAFCFSVVSYNILADCHMRRSDYSYTQPQFLDLSYRHMLLLKELDYLDGDIICMQEVEPTYYSQTLLPAMISRGYIGQIMKRTKDYWNEGEATFVRASKFDIVSQQSLSLRDLAYKEVDDSGLNGEVSRAAKKYLDRADVILLTELLCKKTGKPITVCNIHVVYDPQAPDVQCIQVACAIKQLVLKAGNDLNPHIICGDFNSQVTSPGYQLAKDGYLSDAHIHNLQTLERLDNADGSSRSLINHMWRAFQHTSSNLKSAYELAMGKEPPVTSFTKTSHKTLDYIFHSSASIDTVGVLETLDEPVVVASGGLPSSAIPSDHLSLKAVFRLK